MALSLRVTQECAFNFHFLLSLSLRFYLEVSKVYMDVDMRDNTGRSALMKACETGRIEIFQYLLTKGAIVTIEDLRRRTPLHVASENGHLDIAIALLDNKAKINDQDCYTGRGYCFIMRDDKGMH